jgi:hypothetical protein
MNDMTETPEEIWVTQLGLSLPSTEETENHCHKYIRADIHNKLKKENTKLRKQVKSMSKIVNMSKAKPCN